MESGGVNRKVDVLGRIVIPSEIRHELGIQEGDEMNISTLGKSLLVSPVKMYCMFCGGTEKLTSHMSREVCSVCIDELQSLRATGGAEV